MNTSKMVSVEMTVGEVLVMRAIIEGLEAGADKLKKSKYMSVLLALKCRLDEKAMELFEDEDGTDA